MKTTKKAAVMLTMLVVLGQIVLTSIHAQNLGRISGTVTDQTGAVVVGVTVLAMNVETGVKTQTTTNESGNYNIPA